MAITLGNTIPKTQVDGTGTTDSASFASLPNAGSLVVVELWGWFGSTFDFTTVTDNQGNSYTVLKTVTPSGVTRSAVAYAYNVASSGTFTITINGLNSGSFITWGAQEWRGIATASAVDQTAQVNLDNSSPVDVTTGATTQADELVIAVINSGGGGSNAGIDDPPTGYTSLFAEQDFSSHNAGQASYKIVSATGAQSASWNVSSLSGFTCDANILTFKAASGGGGGTFSKIVGDGFRLAGNGGGLVGIR